MRTSARHLLILNGLTAMACVAHVLVHAIDLSVGEWHDYVVYVLVGMSFVASILHVRETPAESLPA